jgi:hypothetical protein
VKIIYDNERPETHRLVLIGKDGKVHPYPCFYIQLDDGVELVKRGRWGNQKERNAIVKTWKELMDKEGGNEKI